MCAKPHNYFFQIRIFKLLKLNQYFIIIIVLITEMTTRQRQHNNIMYVLISYRQPQSDTLGLFSSKRQAIEEAIRFVTQFIGDSIPEDVTMYDQDDSTYTVEDWLSDDYDISVIEFPLNTLNENYHQFEGAVRKYKQ